MRHILGIVNTLISACVMICIIISMVYAGFALWDTNQIYAQAETPAQQMRELMSSGKIDGKTLTEGEGLSPLQEIAKINPDVTGWIEVPNTGIDYPVVQGEHNLSYINKDVYGNFALAGSIYLDTRNHRDYSDNYNLLYGHNMTKHRMFSDVNLFKEKDFFDNNTEAFLYTENESYILKSLSCVLTPASDSQIMNPENWDKLSLDLYAEKICANAVNINESGLEALQEQIEAGQQPRILALSTCSEEFTDARTILLLLIMP